MTKKARLKCAVATSLRCPLSVRYDWSASALRAEVESRTPCAFAGMISDEHRYSSRELEGRGRDSMGRGPHAVDAKPTN